MEGARWSFEVCDKLEKKKKKKKQSQNYHKKSHKQDTSIAESHPKTLFEEMPTIWMKCQESKPKVDDATEGVYRCPVCLYQVTTGIVCL